MFSSVKNFVVELFSLEYIDFLCLFVYCSYWLINCSFLFFTYKLDICLKGKYTREGGYEDAITTTDGFGPRVYKLYYIYNI